MSHQLVFIIRPEETNGTIESYNKLEEGHAVLINFLLINV